MCSLSGFRAFFHKCNQYSQSHCFVLVLCSHNLLLFPSSVDFTATLRPCALHHCPGYQTWQTSSLQLSEAKLQRTGWLRRQHYIKIGRYTNMFLLPATVCHHADPSGQTLDPIDSQWQDDWKSASVVNCSLVDHPAIRQPGFDRPRHYWSKMNHFGLSKVTVHPATKSGALRLVTSISVANVKQCFISSTAAHSPSWRVAYHNFTWLKMLLFNSWWTR